MSSAGKVPPVRREPFGVYVSTSGRTGYLATARNPKMVEIYVNKDATPGELDEAFALARARLEAYLK